MITNRPRALLIVSVLAASAVLAPATVQAEPSQRDNPMAARSEWIAYESTSYRIHLVRPDGSGDHALDSVTAGPEDNPDWSPDGRWLTFVGSGTDADSAAGLWISTANGRSLRRIVACTGGCWYLDDPAWSPDGRHIAYSRQEPDATRGGTLEIVDIATGRTRTVLTAEPGEFTSGVRWSPDGRYLVFELVHASPSNYDDVTEVTLIRIDAAGGSGTLVTLTEPGVFPQTADWSPSGEWISYAALPTPDAQATDIFVIHPDGTGRTRLTELAGYGGVHTDFTNDSTGIYFVEYTATRPELRLVDIVTHAVSPVGDPVVVGFHPRSQPAR